MANLYIHFPFCKQACHYCNFHFSTKKIDSGGMLDLINKELKIRASEVKTPLESIYFGGGTPSMIEPKSIKSFINSIKAQFQFIPEIEITLEANPDDINEDYLLNLRSSGINRLSLGIQSFFDEDLKLMNRAHDQKQALESINIVRKYFNNYSIDLIYGIPYTTLKDWKKNLDIALDFNPPHISAYVLTVEKKTALDFLVKEKKIALLDEELVKQQYDLLIKKLEQKGYINYEFSSFGKPDYFSVNNLNYWNNRPYLGLGPSSHSFDGVSIRSWNISNNHQYKKGIESGKLLIEYEELSKKDRYNEYLMTSLRKSEGVSLSYVEESFGSTYVSYLEEQVSRHLHKRNLFWDGNFLKISNKAKFLTDGIAADLFIV